jgi:hypothetical protein
MGVFSARQAILELHRALKAILCFKGENGSLLPAID